MDQEFSGAGDEGDVVGFSVGAESFVEDAEDGAESCGGFGGHVECFSDGGASAVDASFAFPFPGFLGVWRDADEGGCLLPVECSKFG